MRTLTLLPLATMLALGACKDTTDPHGEPDVASLRLTLGGTGGQVVTIASNPGCAVTGGPITIVANQSRSITATFLNAAGEPDPVANDPNDFVLAGGQGQQNPTPTPASITFSRTGPFAGILLGTTATTGSMFVSLLHPQEGHEDWGPCSVPITVTP